MTPTAWIALASFALVLVIALVKCGFLMFNLLTDRVVTPIAELKTEVSAIRDNHLAHLKQDIDNLASEFHQFRDKFSS